MRKFYFDFVFRASIFLFFPFWITHAAHPWLTSKSTNRETTPISVYARDSHCQTGRQDGFAAMSPLQNGTNFIDIVISMHNFPEGDDDGNTQDLSDPDNMSTQDRIERLIKFFADSIYESTEGIHVLRTVRIFRDGVHAKKCDIQWLPEIIPNVRRGVAHSNGRIFFGDVMPPNSNGSTPKNWLDPYSLEDGGYVLGHEWGHYYYGLFDEYKTILGKELDINNSPNPSIMNDEKQAVGRNYEHLNFSVAWRGGTEGNYGPYENTQNTAHHFVHGESCWETLVRPPEFQWGVVNWGIYASFGSRVYYPELAAVAPQGQNLPVVNLDKNIWPNPDDMPSRRALDIIWMIDPVIQIVIDKSGSMNSLFVNGTLLDRAKAAACLLVDVAEDGIAIGVIAFDGTVEVVQPITVVSGAASKTWMKNNINSIQVGGATAIGDAAQVALDGLLEYDIYQRAGAVFLLSDGASNAGVNPLDVIPAYAQAQVPIMGFGLGNVDASLEAMAKSTGGKYYSMVSGDMRYRVRRAFLDAMTFILTRELLLEGHVPPNGPAPAPQGVAPLSATTNINIPFYIDSTLLKFWFSVEHDNGASATSLWLVTPNNGVVYPTSVNEDAAGNVSKIFIVSNPMPGEWRLAGTCDSETGVAYYCDAQNASEGYFLNMDVLEHPENPNLYLITAHLEGEAPIENANVTGVVEIEGVVVSQLDFTNAAPGIYEALYEFKTGDKGGYGRFVIKANNNDLQAQMTYRSVACVLTDEVDADGFIVYPNDISIAENFQRTIFDEMFFRFKRIPARIIYVDASRPNDTANGFTWATAKKTIQGAIDQADSWFIINDPATILVAAGEYERVNIHGHRTFIIEGVNNGNAETIINGGNTNRCATLNATSSMSGFTLQNGFTTGNGGGVYSGTLSNCVIRYNVAANGGGAYESVLRDCVVFWNDATANGGGMYACTATGCDVISNWAGTSGGGAYGGVLENCYMFDNIAQYGGGAVFATLTDCVIAENGAHKNGGGVLRSTLTRCEVVGNVAGEFGGGIDGAYGSEVINHCRIENNRAGWAGGGAAAVTLNDCVITGNTANSGGGVSESTVNRCFIMANRAFSPSGTVPTYGGGVYYCTSVDNSVILGNTADFGGGAYYGLMRNCTIAGNTAYVSGAGVRYGTLRNCIVWANTNATQGVVENWLNSVASFTCSVPGLDGEENIEDDPKFRDLAAGDVRLRFGSPCIDAGSNALKVGDFDVAGGPRVHNEIVDMGAHEFDFDFQSEPGNPVPDPADFMEWLDGYWGWQGVRDYATLAGMKGANEYTFWESYVANLTPTNPKSIFYAKIEFVDGAVRVGWEPPDDVEGKRSYRVEGTPQLGAPFGPTNEFSRFFRVNVSMPEK